MTKIEEDETDKMLEEQDSCEVKSPLDHKSMFKALENPLRRMVIRSIGESGKTKEDIMRDIVISEPQLDFQLDYLVKECYAEIDGTIFRLNEKGKDQLLVNIVTPLK
jgi:DNA-binding transcriptional ArsR family regulator